MTKGLYLIFDSALCSPLFSVQLSTQWAGTLPVIPVFSPSNSMAAGITNASLTQISLDCLGVPPPRTMITKKKRDTVYYLACCTFLLFKYYHQLHHFWLIFIMLPLDTFVSESSAAIILLTSNVC